MTQATWRARFDGFLGPTESPRWPQRPTGYGSARPAFRGDRPDSGTSAARTATVSTLTERRLLSLDVADFRGLLENNPSLERSISWTPEERLGMLAGAAATGHRGSGAGVRFAGAPPG
jgi:CRP-like cAMP-binding protein